MCYCLLYKWIDPVPFVEMENVAGNRGEAYGEIRKIEVWGVMEDAEPWISRQASWKTAREGLGNKS